MEDIKKIVEEVKSDINEMIVKGVGREIEGLNLDDLIENTKNFFNIIIFKMSLELIPIFSRANSLF